MSDGAAPARMIRATYEVEPEGTAEDLVLEESLGLPDGPAFVRGRVVSEDGGRAVVEFPESNWGPSVAMLVSSLVAGEAVESRIFTRLRLVDLEPPPGWLPGPAFAAPPGVAVGCIVKPSLGLRPSEVGATAAAIVSGGATLVKDDELMADPPWCRLEDRVRAVAGAVGPGITYCVNVTGPSTTLVDRARRAVELGATGIMVNAFAQGLEGLVALRQAELGVPILAHRVASGPWARNDRFGVGGGVIAKLTRLCGGDYVLVGAFGGKLFDSDDDVRAQLAAVREPLEGAHRATAALGGGMGPHNIAEQVAAAGPDRLVVLLGARAYLHPGGVEAGVRAAVEALGAVAPARPSA